ncbi:MAG: HlyD family secretion protein [Fluviibacter sp.]|jgi:multidrug resistance efflux pump
MLKINVKQLLAQKPKFSTLIFILGGVIALGYFMSGLFHFTDNGFVVQVSTPLAPRVSGVVQEVRVTNGQQVKAGDVLVKLDPTHYEQAYTAALAQYEKALLSTRTLDKKMSISEHNLKAASATLDTLTTQYKAKSHADVKAGIPQIDLADLKNKITAQRNTVESIRDQIEIDKLQVEMEKQSILALKATMETAKTSLAHTTVTAPTDGHVENVFLGIGSHVSPASGMFTLVNDGETFVQANFEETELAGIKTGDKASVYARTYFGKKSFEGIVVANPFGVSRQINQPFSGAPIVQTENKWLLLPQRLPVIIKITDTDPDYPLINGMSTYVRIQH